VASACGAQTHGPSTSQAPVPMFYGCNEAQFRQKSTERAQAPRVGPGSSPPLTRPPAEPKFRSCDQTSRSVLQKSSAARTPLTDSSTRGRCRRARSRVPARVSVAAWLLWELCSAGPPAICQRLSILAVAGHTSIRGVFLGIGWWTLAAAAIATFFFLVCKAVEGHRLQCELMSAAVMYRGHRGG